MSFFANAKATLLSGSTTENTNDESQNQINNSLQSGDSSSNQSPQVINNLTASQTSFRFGSSTSNSGNNVFLNNNNTTNTTEQAQTSRFNNVQSSSSTRATTFGQAQPSTGLGFGQQSIGGLNQASTGPFGQTSTGGFGQASAGTFGQSSTGGFGQASTGSFGQTQSGRGFGQPSTGPFGQSSTGGFGQASTGGFGQTQSGRSFGQTPAGSFAQVQPSGTFGQPSTGGFGQTQSAGTFGQSSTGGFGQTQSAGTFGQSSMGGFGQASTGGFGQTQPAGTFGQSSTGGFGQASTGGFGQTQPGRGFGQASTGGFGQTQSAGTFGQNSTGGFGQTQHATKATIESAVNQANNGLPGTIGHMGRVHVYTDTARNWAVASITGAIRDQGLEELRVRDYWAMKRKTIPTEKIQEVERYIEQNVNLRNSGFIPPPANTIPPNQFVTNPSQNTASTNFFPSQRPSQGSSVFSNAPLQAQPTNFQPQNQLSMVNNNAVIQPLGQIGAGQNQFSGFFGSTGGAKIASQPLTQNFQALPVLEQKSAHPKPTETLGAIQPVTEGKLSSQTTEKVHLAKTENSSTQQNMIKSSPGSFYYQLNKMLFVSNFVDLLSEHNLTSPEGLLEETDFADKLFEFLQGYSIQLPTQVPKFKVTPQQNIIQTIPRENQKISNSEEEREKKQETSFLGTKKSQPQSLFTKQKESEFPSKSLPKSSVKLVDSAEKEEEKKIEEPKQNREKPTPNSLFENRSQESEENKKEESQERVGETLQENETHLFSSNEAHNDKKEQSLVIETKKESSKEIADANASEKND